MPIHTDVESRDRELEMIWENMSDVPMNPDTEVMEGDVLSLDGKVLFPSGTSREEIWLWFDEYHSKGVAYLLYGDDISK